MLKNPRALPLIVLVALAFTLVSLGAVPPCVRAMTLANTSCSSGCFSSGFWNGNQDGAMVTTTVDDPTVSTGESDTKFLEVAPGAGSGNNNTRDYVQVGIDRGHFCTGISHVDAFSYEQTYQGAFVSSKCTATNSQDINHPVTIGVSYYLGNGGGVFIWIQGLHQGDNPCTPSPVPNGKYSWHTISEQVVYKQTSFTGHVVWGGEWTQSQYDNDTSFVYQTRGFDSISVSNPPQFYWHTVPASGNNGGDLYSCIYDAGTMCTPGS